MKNIFGKIAIFGLVLVLGSSCIKETFPMSDTATKEQLATSSSALTAMVKAIPAQISGLRPAGMGIRYGVARPNDYT